MINNNYFNFIKFELIIINKKNALIKFCSNYIKIMLLIL